MIKGIWCLRLSLRIDVLAKKSWLTLWQRSLLILGVVRKRSCRCEGGMSVCGWGILGSLEESDILLVIVSYFVYINCKICLLNTNLPSSSKGLSAYTLGRIVRELATVLLHVWDLIEWSLASHPRKEGWSIVMELMSWKGSNKACEKGH
jgi:hypothetical protein